MGPRVLIFGTGGIGAGYAYVLLRKLLPEDVVAVCRSNYDAASERGFQMNSTIWGSDLHFNPTVVRSVQDAVSLDPSNPFDYVIITCKVLSSTPSVAQLVQSAVTKDTSIVLIQNGIAIEDEYATRYPNNALLSVVVYFAVTQTSPAILEHGEIELLHVGTFPAQAPTEHKAKARSFVQLINDCGATAELHDDVQPQRWAKLLMNASLNPICALTRLRDTQFIHSGPDALQFMEDIMAEIVAVAQALGYDNMNQELIKHGIGRVKTRKPPGVEPSMMADALVGRNMEVEAIVGNLVGLAKEKNVSIPILRTINVLIRALDNSFTQSRQGSA